MDQIIQGKYLILIYNISQLLSRKMVFWFFESCMW